jgi:hypothetical protein
METGRIIAAVLMVVLLVILIYRLKAQRKG